MRTNEQLDNEVPEPPEWAQGSMAEHGWYAGWGAAVEAYGDRVRLGDAVAQLATSLPVGGPKDETAEWGNYWVDAIYERAGRMRPLL